MNKGFTVETTLTRCTTLSDYGLSIGFHTKELTPEEKLMVLMMHNQNGWLLFKPDEIMETEVPKQPTNMDTKTPSQRLRGVLFRLYEQTKDGSEDFEQYYRRQMEKLIEHVKARIDQ